MRTERQEEEDHKDELPASSEHTHHHPAHFGDMALVLDQQLPHNLEQGFAFGEYQYDGSHGELGTPPDGPPVLTNSDQSLLSSFFNDPNGITAGLIPYDTGLPPDHDAVNGGYSFDFGNGTMAASASGGSGHGSLHNKSHANGNTMQFGHTDNWNPQQQHMNADDLSAASTIHNLKSPTPTPNYSNIQLANGISASWGNFAMPTPIPNLHMSNHIPNLPGQPQLRAIPQQTRHHSFTYPNQPLFTQNQMYVAPSEAVHGHPGRPRHSSYSDNPAHQWPGFQQHQYQQGQGMSFGTDTSFTGGRYQSSSHPHQEDKGGNLLNVPMADRAVTRPQTHRTLSDQKLNGAHTQGNLKSPVNGASASQGEFPEPRDRKRRKSQMEGQGELDYTYQKRVADDPSADPSRRESTTFAVYPDSPDGEGSSKKKKKNRETLTDAEKRKHHIESEKKRRELIHTGFSDLQGMVPCLQAGKSGLSRSEILQEIASYLETLKLGNLKLAAELQTFGINPNDPTAPPPIKTEEGIANAYST